MDDPLYLDIFDPKNLLFFRLVNAGNHQAFGELAMPPWVQLDCCTAPSAMIGFAARREDIDSKLFERIHKIVLARFGSTDAKRLEDYNGWIPVSGYCALPSLKHDTMIGFSHSSLVRGLRLGLRSKALALSCYNSPFQIGLTQYTNPALGTHTSFGPLEILETRATVHSRSNETFMYQLRVPEKKDLFEIISEGTPLTDETLSADHEVPVDPETTASAIDELRQKHGSISMVYPGRIERDNNVFLQLKNQ